MDKELAQIRERYKQRDQIDITTEDMLRMIHWVTGLQLGVKGASLKWNDYYSPIHKIVQANHGFVKFIDRGVIFRTGEALGGFSYYPFEFSGDELIVSLIVDDPGELFSMKVVAKAHVHIVEDDFEISFSKIDEELFKRHFNVAGTILKDKHDSDAYMKYITYIQVLMVLCANTYLVLHEKNILIGRIRQERAYGPGKRHYQKNKVNPYYRYKVQVPKNYVPRKFNVNYYLNEWGRCGHIRGQWVLVENAAVIAERSGGKVMWETKTMDGKVQVQRAITPTIVHRRADNKGDNQNKIYTK